MSPQLRVTVRTPEPRNVGDFNAAVEAEALEYAAEVGQGERATVNA